MKFEIRFAKYKDLIVEGDNLDEILTRAQVQCSDRNMEIVGLKKID